MFQKAGLATEPCRVSLAMAKMPLQQEGPHRTQATCCTSDMEKVAITAIIIVECVECLLLPNSRFNQMKTIYWKIWKALYLRGCLVVRLLSYWQQFWCYSSLWRCSSFSREETDNTDDIEDTDDTDDTDVTDDKDNTDDTDGTDDTVETKQAGMGWNRLE